MTFMRNRHHHGFHKKTYLLIVLCTISLHLVVLNEGVASAAVDSDCASDGLVGERRKQDCEALVVVFDEAVRAEHIEEKDEALHLVQTQANLVRRKSIAHKRGTSPLPTSNLTVPASHSVGLSSKPSGNLTIIVDSPVAAEMRTPLDETTHHNVNSSTMRKNGTSSIPRKSHKLPSVAALLVLLVLTVLGPDHLTTLVALCASRRGPETFKIGLVWGFGHTIGMMIIVPILMYLIAQGGQKAIDMWDYIGNYAIGGMMIFSGIYFLVYSSEYVVQQEDGSYVAEACGCSHDALDETNPNLCVPCGIDVPQVHGAGFASAALYELQSPDSQLSLWAVAFGNGGMAGYIIGLFQGFACPNGLLTVIILAQISRNFSAFIAFLFAMVFYLVSVLGTGVATFLIAELMHFGLGSVISVKTLYDSCCYFTLLLGAAWMVLNYFHCLRGLG